MHYCKTFKIPLISVVAQKTARYQKKFRHLHLQKLQIIIYIYTHLGGGQPLRTYLQLRRVLRLNETVFWCITFKGDCNISCLTNTPGLFLVTSVFKGNFLQPNLQDV